MAAGASPSMAGRGTPSFEVTVAASASRISSSTSTTALPGGNSARCASVATISVGCGVRDDVGDLALPIQHVDRDQHDAGLHAGEEQVDELEPVRQLHREPIARFEPAPAQDRSHARGAIRDLAERQLPSTALSFTDQADGPGAAAERQVEQVAEEHDPGL